MTEEPPIKELCIIWHAGTEINPSPTGYQRKLKQMWIDMGIYNAVHYDFDKEFAIHYDIESKNS